jgi:hypothetical protein
MPSGRFEHVFLYNVTSAANGNDLVNAEGLRTGQNGSKANQGQYPWKLMIRLAVTDSQAGGAWTFLIQEASYGGAYSTKATITLTIPTGSTVISRQYLHKALLPQVRVRANATSGGSAPAAWAYGTPGFYGT